MVPTWVLSAPDGPNVGPWTLLSGLLVPLRPLSDNTAATLNHVSVFDSDSPLFVTGPRYRPACPSYRNSDPGPGAPTASSTGTTPRAVCASTSGRTCTRRSSGCVWHMATGKNKRRSYTRTRRPRRLYTSPLQVSWRHEDFMTWNYWPFMRGIHRSPVVLITKSQ